MTGGAPLAPLQGWMQDALRFPERVDPDALARLLPSPRLGAAEGLAVYQRGYLLRIAGCMHEQFPALCHALGRALFDDFVAEYVRDRPPESHTLYDLGRRFADFLEQDRPDRGRPEPERERWIDFMVDLARFERLIFTLFDAPGHEGRPFAGPETPDDRLRLQPAFAVGAWRFPVAAYYHSVRRCEEPPLPPPRASFAALARTDYLTRTIPLAEPHHVFLSAMAGGGGVAEGLAAVARHLGTPLEAVRRSWEDPGGMRERWLAAGFFVAGD
jgi:hypothetical protein